MAEHIRVGLIYGSTRPGRFCDKVARWTAFQLAGTGDFIVELVDPATNADLSDLRTRIGACDAFIIVTPEYNHGYPAPLKSLIDSIGPEWQAKPVGFVSYGGISGGIRAVEQLRQVFAELHAVTMRDSVSFAAAWEQFDEGGNLLQPQRAERTMATMLRHLRWWSIALRTARMAEPYEPAA
jgi:NAD(P)H-dependent FMN reductase